MRIKKNHNPITKSIAFLLLTGLIVVLVGTPQEVVVAGGGDIDTVPNPDPVGPCGEIPCDELVVVSQENEGLAGESTLPAP